MKREFQFFSRSRGVTPFEHPGTPNASGPALRSGMDLQIYSTPIKNMLPRALLKKAKGLWDNVFLSYFIALFPPPALFLHFKLLLYCLSAWWACFVCVSSPHLHGTLIWKSSFKPRQLCSFCFLFSSFLPLFDIFLLFRYPQGTAATTCLPIFATEPLSTSLWQPPSGNVIGPHLKLGIAQSYYKSMWMTSCI